MCYGICQRYANTQILKLEWTQILLQPLCSLLDLSAQNTPIKIKIFQYKCFKSYKNVWVLLVLLVSCHFLEESKMNNEWIRGGWNCRYIITIFDILHIEESRSVACRYILDIDNSGKKNDCTEEICIT
jgi:hypothetical protein